MIKKMLLYVTVLGVLLSLNSGVSASGAFSSNSEAKAYCESTVLTQAEYEDNLKNTSNEIECVRTVIETYLAISHASIVKPDSYNLSNSKCLIQESKRTSSIGYRIQANELQRKLNKANKVTIVFDDIDLSDFKAEISGNKATATIVEKYSYMTNTDDVEFGYTCKYEFLLEERDNYWYICEITTDNPNENCVDFKYEFFDVDELVAQLTEPSCQSALISDCELNKLRSEDIQSSRTTLYKWNYDVNAAITYAENNYSSTSSSIFGYYGGSGGNCQNFASQCVFAGLGGSTSDLTSYPIVYDSTYGSSNSRNWQPGNYYSNINYYSSAQWAWDNAKGFSRYIDQSSVSVEGPFGWTYCGHLNYVVAGDVIWVDWDGSPVISTTSPTLDHAMFVTEVTGAAATRAMNQIYIASHTQHTNSAYERLDNYIARCGTPASASYFAQSRIRGGYYSVQQ